MTNLPGDRPSASGINNWGQIIGTHSVNGSRHACIWEQVGGEWCLFDLSGVSADYSSCDARGINSLGQVVGLGTKTTGGTAAYLYDDGVMRNLNDYLPVAASAWKLSGAHAINDFGQVAGFGYNPVGAYRGFLMDTRAVTYSYTSTGSAVSIKDKSTASKAMTLTDNATITDLNVKVTLYHTRYTDLQFDLVGPNNVTRRLYNAGAVTGSGTKTLVFDDEGAVGAIVPVNPLSYYDGTSTAGKWTLKITDTVKNLKTGSFASFTLDVVPQL
jgi:probable HAF family extracellular repeat protein